MSIIRQEDYSIKPIFLFFSCQKQPFPLTLGIGKYISFSKKNNIQNRSAHIMEENLHFILRGCKKQNRDSQHGLYKLFYAYGMSIAIRYVKTEDEAIHVLNDSFMKAFTRIGKFDLQYDFKPWFRKIVVNTSIDYMKKQKQLQMKSQIEDANHITEREDILSRIGYKELINLVQSLSTAYRTVFNMYVIDGYKHDEIAKTLNISVGTSKSNLSKARAQLRDMITQQLKLKHA